MVEAVNLPENEWQCLVRWREGLKNMPNLCQAALDDTVSDCQKIAASEYQRGLADGRRHMVEKWIAGVAAAGSAVGGFGIGQAACPR